jgi:hypothetical protein
MHGVDDALPAIDRIFAMEKRDAGQIARRRTVDDGAFGQDQANAALGAATIIGGVSFARHAVWCKGARHRRHHEAIGQFERTKLEGAKQRIDIEVGQNKAP